MKPEHFLSTHPQFTKSELRAALPGRSTATLSAHLARWRHQGRIERVKQDVYVAIATDQDGGRGPAPDYIALASRMAPDAAAAYHTALEAHGCAQSLFERFTFVTWTRARGAEYRGRRLVAVRPRAPLRDREGGEPWVETIDRRGLEVRVTSIERTVADVLDRPDLAGGVEEVWRSLLSVPAIDPEALLDYVRVLANRTLAARVGYYLDSRRDELAIPSSTLGALESLLPAQPVYLYRALGGRLSRRWRVFVPGELVGSHEDGLA